MWFAKAKIASVVGWVVIFDLMMMRKQDRPTMRRGNGLLIPRSYKLMTDETLLTTHKWAEGVDGSIGSMARKYDPRIAQGVVMY